MFYVSNFTNITRVRLLRDRQELTTYTAAFAATTQFDPEKAVALMQGFEINFQILVTTGATPALTLYFTYNDYVTRGRR